jgi:hypothetical protein
MRFLKGVLLGLIVTFLISIGIDYLEDYNRQKLLFVCEYVLSADGVRKVGDGIAAYTKAKSHRPGSLGELISVGYISQADLYDASRRKQVDSEGKPITPDVIYFSALRPDDPPDTVLLCTVLRKNKDDKYSVVFNDGRFAQLTRHELVNALNRTYSHICRSLPKTVTAVASPK